MPKVKAHCCAFGGWFVFSALAVANPPAATNDKVSYFKQIRPIFQTHCLGCHQPAKDRGKYIMTSFAQLQEGGSSGDHAIVAGKPKESKLLELITPVNGKARMPEGKPPLADAEIDLVRKWIAEGAVDDTPANAKSVVDAEHPPVYTLPPTIAAMDISPDGKLIALAGFHEALLVEWETSKLVGRLVGLSERIQSLKFSPDGTKLAIAGGNPARMGEVQIWSVAKRALILSRPLSFDTLYGVSWSPDGTKIAVGLADNTVRAIDAKTGEQVLQQGSHSDWILDTVFSKDGSHLVSVGRDMTAKLTEVATQRFVDNITSITPGALKGGIQAVARHPERDEIVIGGSDGIPKVYRMHRLTIRVIGDDGNLIRKLPEMKGRIFSVAVSKDGKRIVAGSALDNSGEIAVYGYEFDTKLPDDIKNINQKVVTARSAEETKKLEAYHAKDVKLIARTPVGGSSIYAVAFHPDNKHAIAAGGDGSIRVIDSVTGKIVRTMSPVPVQQIAKSQSAGEKPADFVRDVNPILSRLGCNAGTCHGSAQGKNGFKLSLRGYDPLFDVRALTDDLAGRRVNVASPDDSLMLLKTTGAAPHAGGALLKTDEPYYAVLRSWIAGGAKLDLKSPRVAEIALEPKEPILDKPKDTKQFKVLARYTDGTTRDVTKEAFIESGNTEVASAAARGGLLTALRRGEAPVLARYEGAYAATTLTVMGDRTGFAWKDPPVYNRIDELAMIKWKRLKIEPSGLCTDDEFLRRVHLDLVGLPPTAEDVRAFRADKRESRAKREAVVDKLIGSKDFVEHWTNKWADLLQVNRKFLGVEGSVALRSWIRGHVEKNTPYDKFVREIVTAKGSNKDNPPAAYFKILRDPETTLENTTHLFLAVRFNCNKCHDHPFERWTQDQYYETSAFFAQVDLQRDPKAGNATIGGTDVERPKPLYEIVGDKNTGDVKHQRTNEPVTPEFPYDVKNVADNIPADQTRREHFAEWLVSPENPYFAKSYVNRLWGYMFGVGIIDPIDDIRASNPPSNPYLLDYLTAEFVRSKFDARKILRLICTSRTYQLSIATNKWNEDDKRNYSHALARRLPAEALLDSVYRVTGSTSKFPGLSAGARAAELSDSGAELPTGFLSEFGRPARESACECERSNTLQLGPVMALVNGATIAEAINQPNNNIAKLVESEKDDRKLIDEIFLRVLNRNASPKEIDAVLASWKTIEVDHQNLTKEFSVVSDKATKIRNTKEAERLARLPKAKADLEAYQKAIAPKVAQQQKDQQERIKKLDADLNAYLATLPKKHAAAIANFQTKASWTPLVPTEARTQAKGNDNLKIHPTGVVEAVKVRGKDVYTLLVDTTLEGITALRLEALGNPKLPNGGPGRAGDGNFVLTEFSVFQVGAKNAQTKVEIGDAKADFEQGDFPITKALDGQNASDRGWAVYPAFGTTHWATFQLKKPIGDGKLMRLRIVLHQQFVAPGYTLGKFRISATTHPKPVGLSVSEELGVASSIPADRRTQAQNKVLADYFAATDGDAKKKRDELAAAKAPLPVDPKLKEKQEIVAMLEQPTPEDPTFVQMRNDVELSKKQLEHRRLTGAQDLAWALINTPAFLFNR